QMDELLRDRLIKKEYTCHLKTLSQVIRENAITHIDLLKIDVENAELDVVNGIAEEDWTKIDQIVIEVHDDNDRLRKITQIISSNGFTVSAYQSEELKGTKLYDVYCTREKKINEGKIEESFKDHWYSPNGLIESVRQRVFDKLPGYMVPSEIVLLDRIPLTSNGKIDRKALLENRVNSLGNKIDFIAPRTNQEKVLAQVWSDV
ncbi:FkbM family methyltransferase, partial [Niastella populi]|uniref:FkbM family methyltransferase n=1 Tax=Niastella populi TaxID=550983 RepID=UPI00105443CB